ncbi:MAG: CD225/dispanin family protein [Bacteroidaceae bacterium]|nr:CD225/dispanin family protein [Bacteroidaceae bacterium]
MENQQQNQQPQTWQDNAQQSQASYVPQPSSHLGLAIFTTLCCCLPLGIVAILKSNKVGDLYAMKQYNAAIAASNEAKKWCIYGIISWFIIDIIWIVFALATGASLLPWASSLG